MKYKLPTIIGIFILIVSMVAGIYFIDSKQVFKISANIEAVPKNVRVTNITNNSLTVTWTTDVESNGFIKWGTSQTVLNKIAPNDNLNKSFVHSVNITGIVNNTDVFFKINSNNKDYNNSGANWQAKTLADKVVSDGSLIASGLVLMQDGTTPAVAIVSLSINGISLSSLTSDQGTFVVPVSMFVNNITDNNIIEININSGPNGVSEAVIYPTAIKSIPTMVIGKSYDFRSLTLKDSNDLPESSLSVPESTTVSSRFEVTRDSKIDTTDAITIESIEDGETITTTDPEFFGTGPKNSTINISVESELQEVDITVNSNGSWNWSPPNELEPGEHKVSIKWSDANGIVRSITRNFVVQASEGPAFEATPSANVLPTIRPTSTPVAVATAQPTPETGSILPTLGLFIMGIGILFSSAYVWNKQDAY